MHRDAAAGSAIRAPISSDKSTLTSIEQSFLEDIFERPFAGIGSRFKRLRISTANGQKTRASLEQKDLLETKAIGLGDRGGQLVLATLTELGASLLRSQGKDVRYPYFQNGGEHEYWKDRIAQHFRNQGFKVTKEAGVNGYADLIASKGSEKIAVEIETGKSNIGANVEKHRGRSISKLILLATNKTVVPRLETIAEIGKQNGVPVEVWTTSQI